MFTNRLLFFLSFAVCAALLGAALYFQYVGGLQPCPLCSLQRLALVVLGVSCFCGFVHNPRGFGRRIYALCGMLAGVFGVTAAARHVWLQHLPADQVPECGPGLNYMLQNLPLQKTLEMLLHGSGECADVQWMFLGLSMPTWTLLWLVGLSLVCSVLMLRARPA